MDKSAEAIFWLKEFSKSWVNVISDEVVYLEQVLEQDSGRVSGVSQGRTYIKDYLSFNLWLEILFATKRGVELEFYIALIEASDSINVCPFRSNQSSRDVDFSYTGQNNAMLVDVVDYRENPKRMPTLFPIRSIIRLHRLDISPDIITKAFELSDESAVLLDGNWENGEVIPFDRKRPCDVVKGSTKSVCNLTYQKSPRRGKILNEIRVEDIKSILRVFLNDTSVRVTCDEGSYFSIENIKVFLRPIDSSEGVSHWLHMLSPCE